MKKIIVLILISLLLVGCNGKIKLEDKYYKRSEFIDIDYLDVDDLIKQSEQLFIKGKFEDSYQVATSVLKRIQTMSDEN
mgnify:CR=1 FL=1